MKIEVDSQEIEEMKTLLGIVDNYATELFLEISSPGPSNNLAKIMQYLGEAQMKLDDWVENADYPQSPTPPPNFPEDF